MRPTLAFSGGMLYLLPTIMATYVYETLTEPRLQFEIRQSMNDPALTVHPDTGEPVRRLITGGFGVLEKGGRAPMPAAPRGGGCSGGSCGCHH